MYALKVQLSCSQGLASAIAAFCSRRVFFFLFSGAMSNTSLAKPRRRALPSRVGRRRALGPALPSAPPSLGRTRVLRGLLSAAMGPEMEPLLLAWSYFRRRKFQLCADLCTQMLEKSPYDQVLAGPRQPSGSRRWGWGLWGILRPQGVVSERKAQSAVDPVSRGTWSETSWTLGWRLPARCVPESPQDPRALCPERSPPTSAPFLSVSP